MRVGFAALLALAAVASAHAEDTAAVLAALNEEPAEARYLGQLCDRVGRGIENHERALDDALACAEDAKCFNAVGKQVEKNEAAQAGVAVFELLEADYNRAAGVYLAKRNTAPPPCRFLADGSRRGVIERMRKLNATMRAQLAPTPKKNRR